MILLWDRILVHRAKKAQSYIQGFQGLYCEYLPPYVPELNPVKNVWGYLKNNPMANDAPCDLLILTKKAHPNGHLCRRSRIFFVPSSNIASFFLLN